MARWLGEVHPLVGLWTEAETRIWRLARTPDAASARGHGPMTTGSERSGIYVLAPHATSHVRDGRVKVAEMGTGGLAAVLARWTDGLAMIQAEDPPYADPAGMTTLDHPFRRMVHTRIPSEALVLDVHGMRDAHPMAVNLGLGGKPSARTQAVAEAIAAAVRDEGLTCVIGPPFQGKGPRTMTTLLQRRDVACIQVEVRRSFRQPQRDPAAASAVLRALATGLRRAGITVTER